MISGFGIMLDTDIRHEAWVDIALPLQASFEWSRSAVKWQWDVQVLAPKPVQPAWWTLDIRAWHMTAPHPELGESTSNALEGDYRVTLEGLTGLARDGVSDVVQRDHRPHEDCLITQWGTSPAGGGKIRLSLVLAHVAEDEIPEPGPPPHLPPGCLWPFPCPPPRWWYGSRRARAVQRRIVVVDPRRTPAEPPRHGRPR